VAELTPLIAELGDEIERQHYIQRLSRLVQVDEMTIAGRVQARRARSRPTRRQHARSAAARRPSASEAPQRTNRGD
jgi:DNA primase